MATKFDAEFIERRMEQQALPRRKPRSGRLFELTPENVQRGIARTSA